MIRDHYRCSFILAIACIVLSRVPAIADIVTFTIDSANSIGQVHTSYISQGTTYQSAPQRNGSDYAHLTGTFTTDITKASDGTITEIQFLNSSLTFIPAPGLSEPGDTVADFGLLLGPYSVALHGLGGHLQSGIYVDNSGIVDFIPEMLSIALDGTLGNTDHLFLADNYGYASLGAGSLVIYPHVVLQGNLQNTSSESMHLTNDHGVLSLNMPFNLVTPLSNLNGANAIVNSFSGTLVATATVPEVSALSLAFLAIVPMAFFFNLKIRRNPADSENRVI